MRLFYAWVWDIIISNLIYQGLFISLLNWKLFFSFLCAKKVMLQLLTATLLLAVVAQSLSPVWFFATLWIAAHQTPLFSTISQSLFKLMFAELVMPSNHLILCHSLLLLTSVFPIIGVFSSESALCITWPKYWSFRSSLSPLSEYSGLIFFRIIWLVFLGVLGTLKSLLQHHNLKVPILQHSFLWSNSHK